ncbi:MAG: group II intron reverse transcriptase/maturase [Bacteroidia bacterium]
MRQKQFNIPKQLFIEAFQLVKKNRGSCGVDKQSIEDFEANFKTNLYKIWNRMSSGSYFPPAVRAVAIPKKSGGTRTLGIPTVGDRVAQTVAKLVFEPLVEPYFHSDSYGYRPNKSALDAVSVTRQRCWKWDWVLEFDIKGLFDNIDHNLLMKAVRKHTNERWVLLYIERWLKAPLMNADGKLIVREQGTPQGGVISPVLANLFLHYAFDTWLEREIPGLPWCRYADDGLVHCESLAQAEIVREKLAKRFEECGLELHPSKTKVVYCKDGSRRGEYETTNFDFLGYRFRPRLVKNSKRNSMFVSFTPAVSPVSLKAMRTKVRKDNIRNRSDLSLQEIARWYNATLIGWINYYGRFNRSALYPLFRHFNKTLVAWAVHKFKRFRNRKVWASKWLEKISENNPSLIYHWRIGMQGAFA